MSKSDVFDIDFNSDGGADSIDLNDILEDVSGGKPDEITLPTETLAAPAKEPEDIIDLPDDGFTTDVAKPEVVAPDDITTNNEKPPANDEPSTSPYSSLAKLFHERGVISDTEGFDDLKADAGIDKFMDALEAKLTDGVTSEMNPEQKEYLEALKSGVPTEWYHEKKSVVQQLANVDEAKLVGDTDAARNARYTILYNDFKMKGHDDTQAKTITDGLFALNKDVESSKTALESIKNSAQAEIDAKIAEGKTEQEAELQKQKEAQEALKTKIYDTQAIIPGGPKLSKKLQDKVYKTVTNVVAYDDNNQPVTEIFKALKDNPIETQITLGYLWAITDGGKNMNTLNTTASTKVAKEVEDLIINGSLTGGTPGGASIPSTSTGASMIESLKAAMGGMN